MYKDALGQKSRCDAEAEGLGVDDTSQENILYIAKLESF